MSNYRWGLFLLPILLNNSAISSEVSKSKNSRTLNLSQFISDQSRNYKFERWEAFFGAAQAYRQFWWDQFPSVRLISLEALALIRLCRFSEAVQVMEAAESWLKKHPFPVEISHTRSDIEASSYFAQIRVLITGFEKLRPRLLKAVVKRENVSQVYWPMNSQMNESIMDRLTPSSFRVSIESECR